MKISLFIIILGLSMTVSIMAQPTLNIDVQNKKSPIQKELFGIFFEDINFAADGGLYAEMIKNRSFEFDQPFVGWLPFGDVVIKDINPCFDRNPHYASITEKGLLRGAGLENSGFTGMGFVTDNEYRFSLYARTLSTDTLKIKVECIDDQNLGIGKDEINIVGNQWIKYTTTIKVKKEASKGKIRITLLNAGNVDIDHISLFPVNTWNNHENGLRKDLAQALADLNPGLFRFPGGCIIEGNTLDTRYQWKNSVGPVENRPINENRWNYTFKHKFYPDYYQSYGLGFYEYFLFSEEVGAEPLPVVSCGFSCQYESHEKVPLSELGAYVQDALDLIEFANGPVSSVWGKVRADMGHPAPFNLKYIAIGNEQWGEDYPVYLAKFMEPIHKQYPSIKIVGTSGPRADGKDFDYLWPEMKRLKVDLVDEHYYMSPEWFLANAGRYDNYDRKGPKVFAGEFAAHPKSRDNNLEGAIAEAAFMTGLERNADVVYMATYAPLLANIDAWQWCPDMIWFNTLNMMKTPNYYVQQMYGNNGGTHVLQMTASGTNCKGENGIYASSVWDAITSSVIVKIVNTNTKGVEVNLNLTGLSKKQSVGKATMIYLQNDNLEIKNTLAEPYQLTPENRELAMDKNTTVLKLKPNMFAVVRIAINE